MLIILHQNNYVKKTKRELVTTYNFIFRKNMAACQTLESIAFFPIPSATFQPEIFNNWILNTSLAACHDLWIIQTSAIPLKWMRGTSLIWDTLNCLLAFWKQKKFTDKCSRIVILPSSEHEWNPSIWTIQWVLACNAKIWGWKESDDQDYIPSFDIFATACTTNGW